jgi:hypothetical protein
MGSYAGEFVLESVDYPVSQPSIRSLNQCRVYNAPSSFIIKLQLVVGTPSYSGRTGFVSTHRPAIMTKLFGGTPQSLLAMARILP